MHDSTVLPDLRMLPSSLLVTHEDWDPRRVERLSQRIQQEGVFSTLQLLPASLKLTNSWF